MAGSTFFVAQYVRCFTLPVAKSVTLKRPDLLLLTHLPSYSIPSNVL